MGSWVIKAPERMFTRRKLVHLLLNLICLPLLGEACFEGLSDVQAQAHKAKKSGTAIPTGQVNFIGQPFDITVMVEVVSTPRTRERGLMFRKSLAKNHGMLFVFPKEEEQFFWMKNTYVPLDIIFVDSNFKVVGVLSDIEPMTTISRTVKVPSRYVVEVNAGFSQKYKITKGTQVIFKNILEQVKH